MSNPWLQSVLCSLIAALLFEVARAFLRRGYPRGPLLFAAGMSTMVFAFGNILEPAVYALLEPDDPVWTLLTAIRKAVPGVFTVTFFVAGLLPGIVTGLMVTRGRSLTSRLLNGVLWAPVSLSLFDAVWYGAYYLCCLDWEVFGQKLPLTGGRLAFSLLSNISGGVAGGLIIGGAVHAFVQLSSKLNAPGSTGSPNFSVQRPPRRRR